MQPVRASRSTRVIQVGTVPETDNSTAFDAAMRGFAPFEPSPIVAVAVSGGPDSMALTLLLDDWARRRGGSVFGFTVDHGLRPEAASEARQVGDWLKARYIAHEILRWTGEKPGGGLQASARQARYALLAQACAARGILHLATAHHADDQAETLLFRRDRGSGADGMAGMPASRGLGPVRLIRPLLGWAKTALERVCGAEGQPFLMDPSNRSDRFARTGLRRRLAGDEKERQSLLAISRSAAQERQARANSLIAVLGRIAELRPDGAATLDWAEFSGLEANLRGAVLAAALKTAGGGDFAPTITAVSRLLDALAENGFRGASLAGCAVRRWKRVVLLCREPGRIGPAIAPSADCWRLWDRRFLLRLAQSQDSDLPFTVNALGGPDFAVLRRRLGTSLPGVAGAGLPAVRSGGRLLAVPSLGWSESGAPQVEQRFKPLWPFAPETFTVV